MLIKLIVLKILVAMNKDLKSSAQTMLDSKYITQVIHFVGGEKRTFHEIFPE